jgi:magnesium transporter
MIARGSTADPHGRVVAIEHTSRVSATATPKRGYPAIMLSGYPRSWNAEPRPEGVWIDLLSPTDQEKSTVERTFGLRVPPIEELAEIESTSRLRTERDALYVSAPLVSVAQDGSWVLSPTGFVLGKNLLMTVRFANLTAIEVVAKELGDAKKIEPAGAFVRILEQIVDGAADHLELLAEQLDKASALVFRHDQPRTSRLSRDTVLLRSAMTQIGRASERISHVHYMLTCLDRIAKFVADRGRDWTPSAVAERLQSVHTDVASLNQFDESLLSRVQLVQDAASAIISIGQNEVMKVLTVASVAGVPPVLIAGIYGMNFKNMPELNWPWGYGFALALIVISTLIPLLWFKWKDWI